MFYFFKTNDQLYTTQMNDYYLTNSCMITHIGLILNGGQVLQLSSLFCISLNL